MKQQSKEKGNFTRHIRSLFINSPTCVAVRKGAIIYQLDDPTNRRGPWTIAHPGGTNAAKRVSRGIQEKHGRGSVVNLSTH